LFRRPVRVRFTKLLQFSRDSRLRIARWRTVLHRGVQFQVSRFSSVPVRQVRVGRVRLCVRASAGQCIPHVPALAARVPWELAQDCRLPERLRVPAAVPADPLVVQVRDTFLVA
jgi:hypothetical protein